MDQGSELINFSAPTIRSWARPEDATREPGVVSFCLLLVWPSDHHPRALRTADVSDRCLNDMSSSTLAGPGRPDQSKVRATFSRLQSPVGYSMMRPSALPRDDEGAPAAEVPELAIKSIAGQKPSPESRSPLNTPVPSHRRPNWRLPRHFAPCGCSRRLLTS
jgi:hypothetical protein